MDKKRRTYNNDEKNIIHYFSRYHYKFNRVCRLRHQNHHHDIRTGFNNDDRQTN